MDCADCEFPLFRIVTPCLAGLILSSGCLVPRKIPISMRILPFPFRRSINAENDANDWSQDEIADFYRAHRLLVENGAGIGIDRGVSDIGEPWMVFFDGSSQDVFLHVARIDNRCHLICESLDLRLSASNINQLIAEFENSVRELLSIRAERSKNVVIHPAARIIMSISAIFLLFKLETGDAQAKALHEKNQGGLEAGTGRWNDKASASMARAQAAFGRVFESTDSPGHVALLAGAVIALELSRSIVQSSDDKPSETRADIFVEQEKSVAPVFEIDNHVVIKTEDADSPENGSYNIKSALAAEYVVADQSLTLDKFVLNTQQKILKVSEVSKVLVAGTELKQNRVISEASDDTPQIGQTPFDRTAVVVNKDSETIDNNQATKALKEFIFLVNGEDENSIFKLISSKNNDIKDDVKEISAEKLDFIDDKVGLFIRTKYDKEKLFELVKYFANNIDQYELDYITGKVLIEEKNVEALPDHDIGLWTNVMIDGSTFSVVGHVGLIDDVFTFFA
jgi:hypothetical protein